MSRPEKSQQEEQERTVGGITGAALGNGITGPGLGNGALLWLCEMAAGAEEAWVCDDDDEGAEVVA